MKLHLYCLLELWCTGLDGPPQVGDSKQIMIGTVKARLPWVHGYVVWIKSANACRAFAT